MLPILLHLASFLTAVCVAGLWQGILIAVMAAAICASLRQAPAALRHTVLIAAFAGVVLLPWIGLHGRAAASGGHSFSLAPQIALGIAALWIAAAALRAMQLFLAWRHLCKVRRAATVVQVQGAEAFAAGTRRALLCSSPDVDSPTILGFRSPRLLLPEWMVPELSEVELQQIALHECEHLRRRDDWVNLLLQMALVVSPLNPALLWLNRTIRLQRELAVDAAVVARTAKPLAYAACLTRLAEQREQRSRLRLALAAWGRKPELVQRVHALLQSSSAWTRVQSAWAFAAALLLLAGATQGMVRVPQFVRVGSLPALAGSIPSAASATFALPDVSSSALPLLRTSAEQGSRHNGAFAPTRIVPATFETTTPRSNHIHAVRNNRKDRRAKLLTTRPPDRVFVQQTVAPHMMRTRYTAPNLRAASEHRAEATPAIYYTPYAAVPVENGWLLIEL